jgi:hypothetical protein
MLCLGEETFGRSCVAVRRPPHNEGSPCFNPAGFDLAGFDLAGFDKLSLRECAA